MSDQTVFAILRSDAPLVVIEAPAGCGKTYQGADYARELATIGRVLVLTHTHAACSAFVERTASVGSRAEVRTVDSLIANVAAAYHTGLGLPADVAAWSRQNKEGYAQVALRVAQLLKRYPMISASLAHRYPFVVCDEHQDCSGDQHAIAMALLNQGAQVRIFADPMQRIYNDKQFAGADPPLDWTSLCKQADAVDQLDTPHRWHKGCPELGKWVLSARNILKLGHKIDLRSGLPQSVRVAYAENIAPRLFEYQLSSPHRRPIDAFVQAHSSFLVLTHYNDTALSLRSFFNRRVLLWEGHTRQALDALTRAVDRGCGQPALIAKAAIDFMSRVGKGFSRSAFGDRLEKEVREGCTASTRGKPAVLQDLGRCLLAEPDHKGVAKLLRRLADLRQSDAQFSDIEIDCHKEFWDAIGLGLFDDLNDGFAEITNRRTYSHPKPPDRAISTIHKSKGLDCDNVIVMPCDAQNFPDKTEARCLLYVAISRARSRLLLVVSRDSPSPLLVV